MDYTYGTVSQFQLNVFLYKSCCGSSVFFTAIETLTETSTINKGWFIAQKKGERKVDNLKVRVFPWEEKEWTDIGSEREVEIVKSNF